MEQPDFYELAPNFRKWLADSSYDFAEGFYVQADQTGRWSQKDLAELDSDVRSVLLSL